MKRCRQSMLAAIVLIMPLAGFHVAATQDSAALPEPTIVDHVACYTVTGVSARSIRARLESRSQTGGESRHGSTRSTFEVISKPEEASGLCRVSRQKILVEITTELPRWEPGRAAPESLKAAWNESSARLVRHEAGHRENVLQAVAVLREKLRLLEPQARCLTAQVDIDIALENVLYRLERREAYYDRLTQGGSRDLPGAEELKQAGTGEERDVKLEKLRRLRTSRFPAE